MKKHAGKLVAAVALLALASAALAGELPTDPITNWMTLPATPIAKAVQANAIFIVAMTLPYLILPQALLLYAIFRFRDDGVRKPATFHDNIKLEIFWTFVPALTLIGLAIPSYKLIKQIETPPPADERVEIIGKMFVWEYRYPEYGIAIADTALVIPAGKNIVCTVTSNDVNHSWWVPAFAIKMDAVAGRLHEVWFNVEEPGWYKGQCAELCGALHSKMLIDVKVVPEKEFRAWVDAKVAEMNAPVEEAPAAEAGS